MQATQDEFEFSLSQPILNLFGRRIIHIGIALDDFTMPDIVLC